MRLQTGSIPIEPPPLHPAYPALRLENLTRAELVTYLNQAWALEDLLFSGITREEAYYANAEPLRHPPIFYFGHSAVFYVNKMVLAGAWKSRVNPAFETLFAEGVDPATPADLPKRTDWPSIHEVQAYRYAVRDRALDWAAQTEVPARIVRGSTHWALLMAIEHQRIHFETSSLIIRQIPADHVGTPTGWVTAPFSRDTFPANDLVRIKGGPIFLGRTEDVPVYGWDNEFGTLRSVVPDLEVSRFLVSNGEYLDFVRSSPGVPAPRFWVPDGNRYVYRGMFGLMELPLDWPVEVNFYEAKAFAQWKGLRLPTEAEYALYAYGARDANLDFKTGSPVAVDQHLSQNGLGDVRGNVWQWIDQDFYPLPGFDVDPLYPNFSRPYFTARHKMMLGGSWATTGAGATAYYRLWFRMNFYQHAGFRLVRTPERKNG